MNKKKSYIQMLRILACILVIYNHTYGYYLFGLTTGRQQIVFMILTVITRINVPLFLMISGSLLLGKNESWSVVLKKRFLKLLACLLLFEFILLILNKYFAAMEGTPFSFSLVEYVVLFLQNGVPGAFPYWYLYSLLGFFLMLPFLQRVANGMTGMDMVVLLVIHFLWRSILPIVNLMLQNRQMEPITITSNLLVPFAIEKFMFYPLVGYYIDYHINMERFKRWHLFGILCGGVLSMAITILCVFEDAKIKGDYTQDLLDLFVYVIAIVFFLSVKYIFSVGMPCLEQGKMSILINAWGGGTLGIYLLDPCIKIILFKKYELVFCNWFNSTDTNSFLGSILWIVISVVIGTICTFILKRIPLVRKLL